jgi:hypothetical protein
VTTSGSLTTAANKGYNGTVPAGGSVEFGLIVTGSGDPTSCTINGAPCGGGAPVPSTPTTAPTTRPPATRRRPAGRRPPHPPRRHRSPRHRRRPPVAGPRWWPRTSTWACCPTAAPPWASWPPAAG